MLMKLMQERGVFLFRLFCLRVCEDLSLSTKVAVFICFDWVYILHSAIDSLCRADKGQTLKASYIHYVDRPDGFTVAAEISHSFSTFENRFTIGSSQSIDSKTVVKTRFSDDGKAAFQCQRAWRPNSLITLSAEYDSTKIFGSSTKFGLALALKP